MAKSTDGIEVGSYSTSGVNDKADDPKQRGGDGSAKMSHPKMMVNGNAPPHHFAHKRPMTG